MDTFATEQEKYRFGFEIIERIVNGNDRQRDIVKALQTSNEFGIDRKLEAVAFVYDVESYGLKMLFPKRTVGNGISARAAEKILNTLCEFQNKGIHLLSLWLENIAKHNMAKGATSMEAIAKAREEVVRYIFKI